MGFRGSLGALGGGGGPGGASHSGAGGKGSTVGATAICCASTSPGCPGTGGVTSSRCPGPRGDVPQQAVVPESRCLSCPISGIGLRGGLASGAASRRWGRDPQGMGMGTGHPHGARPVSGKCVRPRRRRHPPLPPVPAMSVPGARRGARPAESPGGRTDPLRDVSAALPHGTAATAAHHHGPAAQPAPRSMAPQRTTVLHPAAPATQPPALPLSRPTLAPRHPSPRKA